jgi:hypothetical protein
MFFTAGLSGLGMLEQADLSTEEFASAVETLRQLIPSEELDQLQPSGPATVYTTAITIWMMILQRLGGGRSQAATVKDVLVHSLALLPDNKRVREGTLSKSSAAYSQARQRINLETVEFLADRVSDSLIDAAPSWFEGRRAFILDGTTITLPPTPELQEAFPPATNQHGEAVWPVALLLVAHELQSGCALPPEIGAMYGERNTSEAELARAMAKRMPRASIALADSGHGIFSVGHAMVEAGHSILFRLTKARFRSMLKNAVLAERWDGHAMWKLRWTPSANDRRANPRLPAEAALDVRLHEVPLPNGESLFLVTTLPVDSRTAGEAYRRRYDVEHDIRDVKVSLNTERMRAKSVDTIKKELLTSIVAYNLVVQFRRQAAALANLPPRRLSFTGVWNTFESFLLKQTPCSPAEWIARYKRALKIAAQDKLPNRPGRSYSRRAHPRRAKSTRFMKFPNSKSSKNNTDPPPEKPK